MMAQDRILLFPLNEGCHKKTDLKVFGVFCGRGIVLHQNVKKVTMIFVDILLKNYTRTTKNKTWG